MPKYTVQTGKDLYSELKCAGSLEYGEVIYRKIVHILLDIEIPETGTKQEFDNLALFELAAIDYVRNILLGQGKYLSQHQGDYRILLPSENVRQVEQYMNAADKKLKRALKLSRNTPETDTKTQNNTDIRIMMKRETIKQRRDQGDMLK